MPPVGCNLCLLPFEILLPNWLELECQDSHVKIPQAKVRCAAMVGFLRISKPNQRHQLVWWNKNVWPLRSPIKKFEDTLNCLNDLNDGSAIYCEFVLIACVNISIKQWLGCGFKHFSCSPLLGEDSHFDEHIFQMGWNHQSDAQTQNHPQQMAAKIPRHIGPKPLPPGVSGSTRRMMATNVGGHKDWKL